MLEELLRTPSHFHELAVSFADLHFKIHSVEASGLPEALQRTKAKVDAVPLSDEARGSFLSAFDSKPEMNLLLHGDFSPANVLVNHSGVVAIDWYDAGRGDPAADVARTCLLLLYAHTGSTFDLDGSFQSIRRGFHDSYLSRYTEHDPSTIARVESWLTIAAAARLADARTQMEARSLIRIVESKTRGT